MPPMSNPDYCRTRAEECEAAAARVSTFGTSEQLLQLARAWRNMAEQLELRRGLPRLAPATE